MKSPWVTLTKFLSLDLLPSVARRSELLRPHIARYCANIRFVRYAAISASISLNNASYFAGVSCFSAS